MILAKANSQIQTRVNNKLASKLRNQTRLKIRHQTRMEHQTRKATREPNSHGNSKLQTRKKRKITNSLEKMKTKLA